MNVQIFSIIIIKDYILLADDHVDSFTLQVISDFGCLFTWWLSFISLNENGFDISYYVKFIHIYALSLNRIEKYKFRGNNARNTISSCLAHS